MHLFHLGVALLIFTTFKIKKNILIYLAKRYNNILLFVLQ